MLFRFEKHSEPISGPSFFFQDRPISVRTGHFCQKTFIFTPGQFVFRKPVILIFLYLHKLTVRDIFGKKDRLYRKIRTTNEFFGVDLPRESQIIKNYLVLAKNYMGSRFKWPYYIKSVQL